MKIAPLLLLIAILPAPALGAEGVAGRWTAVQGRVSVSRVGAEASRLARPGEGVVVGDLLEAGADSRAQVLLADDSVLKFSPGTALRILQYSFEPASGRRTAVVKVIRGRVRLIVAARKNSRFNVESPHAALAVAAADFVTIVSAAETAVAVLEGSLRVKNISNLVVSEIDLWSNQATKVREKAVPDHPVPISPGQRREFRSGARVSGQESKSARDARIRSVRLVAWCGSSELVGAGLIPARVEDIPSRATGRG